MHLRESRISKFPGGPCPHTPLGGNARRALQLLLNSMQLLLSKVVKALKLWGASVVYSMVGWCDKICFPYRVIWWPSFGPFEAWLTGSRVDRIISYGSNQFYMRQKSALMSQALPALNTFLCILYCVAGRIMHCND